MNEKDRFERLMNYIKNTPSCDICLMDVEFEMNHLTDNHRKETAKALVNRGNAYYWYGDIKFNDGTVIMM